MAKQKVGYYELEGTYREIGGKIAAWTRTRPQNYPVPQSFTKREFEEAFRLYDTYCPGIREEVEGFSEGSGIPVEHIAFSWMTYLVPRCCGLILTGKKTNDHHTKLARSYEFDVESEDFRIYRTAPAGKYAHLSGSIADFGRTEGINEKGLAVSMSSCGLPVSNLPYMRAPKIKGLQFWAAIRCLLENCSDVKEALELVMTLPIAYNLNLYLADADGRAALFETFDGEKAFRQIDPEDKKQSLCGTNHILLERLLPQEPFAMKNSIVRQRRLQEFAESKDSLTEKEIREFLLRKYPDGMTSYYYEDGFGTIKSVILDTAEQRYSICWLGQQEHGWTDYFLSQKIENHETELNVITEKAEPSFFERQALS